MIKVLFTRASDKSEYTNRNEFSFDYLPNRGDFIKIGYNSMYSVDMIVFHNDENADNIQIYATKSNMNQS